MRVLTAKSMFLSIWASICCSLPAMAHVKWFLNRPESELLKQPKPALFAHLSIYNTVPVMLALAVFYILSILNNKFSNSFWNKKLLASAYKYEPVINLFMAIGLGVSLIYCGVTRTLLVPNFIICSHCPQWLPGVEILLGSLLVSGLFSRLATIGIFGLMYMAIAKHGLIECLDALPLVGLTIYFLVSGRNRLSLDYIWGIDRVRFSFLMPYAHAVIRWAMGLGLIILSLDEKLLNPQLAINLLQYAPSLNALRGIGCSNEMFVLLAGLMELLLGASILFGLFPRLAVFILLLTFSATTMIFGWEEFFGHAGCYSMILSIMFWGAGVPVFSWNIGEIVKSNLGSLFGGGAAVGQASARTGVV